MPDAGNPRNTAVRLRGHYIPKEKFKLDPKRPERFRLRLARYVVLSQDISQWAGDAAAQGKTLSVLDVGCGWGPLLCQLDAEPHFDNIRFSGADIFDDVRYRRERYDEFFAGDLTQGYPEIASDHYDVAVCEQVLEHLDKLDTALKTLERVVRPGGILVIGVPIFIPPLHLARKHLVPRFGKLIGHPESASHQQAFSLSSFRRLLRGHPRLTLVKARGFRIISGGLLRPLENYGWWWQLNRRLGDAFPALCIEVQVILKKAA
ncbi:MAG: class I SAM-dependent methyltransferase [Alphaproteobacteria bacterium]|nr:class I SAM-dependent methyltransferase [Alphaproteobacteria bacterium]